MVLVVVLTLPALAQRDSGLFGELTDKYADKEGFSASQISSEMFDLYLKKRDIDEESPVFEALKKLDYILVVSQSRIEQNAYRDIHGSGNKSAESDKTEDKDDTEILHSDILNHYKKYELCW